MYPLLANLLEQLRGNLIYRFKYVRKGPFYGFLFLSLCGRNSKQTLILGTTATRLVTEKRQKNVINK